MEGSLQRMLSLLQEAHHRGASDLHLSAGAPAMLRVAGRLAGIGDMPLSGEETADMSLSLLDAQLTEKFQAEGEVDLAYELEGGMRFRLNVFRQQGQVSLAARMIASAVPTLEQLGVPLAARDWMSRRQGLLLVTGPTGSGKSSTLAALIGHLNRTESRHIVTLEDPIEFLHPHGKSLVDQREVGPGYRQLRQRLARSDAPGAGRYSRGRDARSRDDGRCLDRSGDGPSGALDAAYDGCSADRRSDCRFLSRLASGPDPLAAGSAAHRRSIAAAAAPGGRSGAAVRSGDHGQYPGCR